MQRLPRGVQSVCRQHNAIAAVFNFYLHARFPLCWPLCWPLFTTHLCKASSSGCPSCSALVAANTSCSCFTKRSAGKRNAGQPTLHQVQRAD